MEDKLLKRKIRRDDVIIINEDLLPKKVMPIYTDQGFTQEKVYDVLGMTWENFSDRSRMLVYILKNDNDIIKLMSLNHFKVTQPNKVSVSEN